MNYKEDILDTFDKLMFFSKPIERETTPEIKEQNKIIREQWIQAIRDYLYEHEQISNSAPLEAFEKLKNKPTLSGGWDKRKTAYDYNKLEYDIIETALKKQEQDQKKLKVLEIIKDKVQFEFLEEREEGKIIQRYFVIGNCMFPVIQEEFEIVKGALYEN